MIEKITCPRCGKEQVAKIKETPLWHDYTHYCVECGYWITESEWESNDE